MKIGAIEKLCKSARRILIINDEERGIQWLGDGYCLYPLFKLPRLNGENIFAIFDIPEDKQGKIYFEEKEKLPMSLNVEDVSDGETPITPESICISYNGKALVPIKCSVGVMMIDKRYLGVFDGDVAYYERLLPSGRPYVVAKEGMFTAGIILPEEPNEKLAELLVNTGEGLALASENRKPDDYDEPDVYDEDEE